MSVSFDEPNLASAAGLLPVMTLARDAGLQELADDWLTVPTDKGANAGLIAGADSIDDMSGASQSAPMIKPKRTA